MAANQVIPNGPGRLISAPVISGLQGLRGAILHQRGRVTPRPVVAASGHLKEGGLDL